MRHFISHLSVKSVCLAILLALMPAVALAMGPPPLNEAEKPFVGKWHAEAEGETPHYVWNWFDIEMREDRTSTITRPYKDGTHSYGRDYWRLRVKRGFVNVPLIANVYASSQLANVKWLDADTMTFSWSAPGFAGSYSYKAKRVK